MAKPAKPPEVLLTPTDAGRLLKMTGDNVRRLTRRGVLTPVAITGFSGAARPMALYRLADVEALAAKRARPERRPSGRPPRRRT